MLPAALSYMKKRKRHDQNLEDFFHKSEFTSVWQEYQDIRSKEDKQALRRFVSNRKAAAFEPVNFHIVMDKWERETNNAACDRKEILRTTRGATVDERMVALGYTPDDRPTWGTGWDELVYTPHRFTRKGWEILRPKLIKMIDDERMHIRWDAMLKRVKEAGEYEELLEKFLSGAWNTIDDVVF